MMRHLSRYLIGVLCVLLTTPAFAYAQASTVYEEYEVKAAFLYNFAKFVEWPTYGLNGEITLCLLGHDPFGGALDNVIGHPVGKRRFAVQHLPRLRAADLSGCQMLYISASEQAQLDLIVAQTRGMPVLTVADTGGFAHRGVMFNFFLEQNRVRFEINQAALMASPLKPSARLLQLGRLINPER